MTGLRTTVVVAVLAILASGVAEAQFGGRGRGGARGSRGDDMADQRDRVEAINEFPVDALWSAITFGLDLSDEALVEIRPIVAHAWQQRRTVFQVARQDDTWKAAKERMKDLRKQVEDQLEQHLAKDQMKLLKDLLKEMRKTARAGR